MERRSKVAGWLVVWLVVVGASFLTVVLRIPDLNLQEILGLAVDIIEGLGFGLTIGSTS